MSAIGLMIKKRRKELGLTQEELATRLGYKSKSTINKIESGINDITQAKIIQFAKALETTPAHLMNLQQDYTLSFEDNTSMTLKISHCNKDARNQRLLHYAVLMSELTDEQLDIIYQMMCQMLPQTSAENSLRMNQSNK